MTTIRTGASYGRLGNQIIRNIAVSLIAEKHDLYVAYSYPEIMSKLGVRLFVGNKTHVGKRLLTDDNYFETLNKGAIDYNLNPNANFFQTKEITNLIYNYIDGIKTDIIDKNPFKERYNNNKDLLVHIRLSDATQWNVGLDYYIKAINNTHFDKLFITTDEPTHPFISHIKGLYENVEILHYDEIKTFQFASTCKNIVLSHGSFSAVIGYLAFFSKIYYPDYSLAKKMWFGDMFSIDGWIRVTL
jgi:hypothetical protein